jgi:peptidoglycan/LPS O-acetylase OafA/YrhL
VTTSPEPRRDFRPDIQGLRALAVGTVILAHAGFGTFAGGFVGVDVFFVVSGFLITGLLWRAAERDGRISLVDFYARRARRILPAATLVLVATVVASVLFLPLVRAYEITVDAVWAALFGANLRFTAVGTDYFATGEPASPVQHYWSLAVEEQYYLVWPLLVIGALLLARRLGRRGPRARPVVLGVLGAVVVASLAWSVVQTQSAPTPAYFSTFTRAWELGAGSAAALLLAGGPVRAPRWVLEVVGALGLVAVLAAVLLYEPATAFPGYAALLPVLGTVALLVAGATPRPRTTAVQRLFSLAPARVVGDWSYSLYLWHWPVLRIAEDRLGVRELSPLPLALALLVTVALSALTYRFVETPFRTARTWRPRLRGVLLYPLSLVVVLAAVGGGRAWVDDRLGSSDDNPAITTAEFAGSDLSADPAVALVQASVLAARDGQAVPSDLSPPLLGLRQATAPLGECDYRTGTRRLCPVGDEDAERSIVLIGDSHARAWTPGLDEVGRQAGYRVYNFVFSGCSASQVVQADPDADRPWAACEDFKDWVLQQVDDLDPAVVVVATSAVSPVIDPEGDAVGMTQDQERFRRLVARGFREQVRLLAPLTPRLVVLGDVPKLPREPGVCLSSGDVDLGDCLFAPGPVMASIQRSFGRAVEGVGGQFVDAQRWFCWDGECPSVVGRTITMRDSEHITPEYAEQLAPSLASGLGLEPPAQQG